MSGANSARPRSLGNQVMTPTRILPAFAISATLAISVSPSRPAIADTNLRGAGSTFSAALYNQWIENYHREHPTVSVTYDAVGSGEGVRRFVAGLVDFGASDVVLSDREAAQISRGAIMVPSTAGMVVLAYNLPGMSGELRLSRD